jgi:hypothetical protein
VINPLLALVHLIIMMVQVEIIHQVLEVVTVEDLLVLKELV